RALQVSDPSLRQVVVERSAAIIRLAEREMGLRRDAALVVRKADARAALLRMPEASADVVAGDAFLDAHTPAHLTTVEVMADVARVLRPGGAYVVNLIDEQPWSVLGVHAAAATAVFADVLAAGSRGVARLRDPGNVFLIASAEGINRAALTSALVGGAHPSALVAAGQMAALAGRHRARHDADG
ncbi:MAG TPA: fused MFS/spermidine synthase, partial [Euzebya sp.]|nr:fused MFS/spermidine synthase [Euzebya sp.]